MTIEIKRDHVFESPRRDFFWKYLRPALEQLPKEGDIKITIEIAETPVSCDWPASISCHWCCLGELRRNAK